MKTVDKVDWVNEAAGHLMQAFYSLDWTWCEYYADSLYHRYVVQNGTYCEPEDAVTEDIKYWGEE